MSDDAEQHPTEIDPDEQDLELDDVDFEPCEEGPWIVVEPAPDIDAEASAELHALDYADHVSPIELAKERARKFGEHGFVIHSTRQRPSVLDEAQVTETEVRFSRHLSDDEREAVLAWLGHEGLDLIEAA